MAYIFTVVSYVISSFPWSVKKFQTVDKTIYFAVEADTDTFHFSHLITRLIWTTLISGHHICPAFRAQHHVLCRSEINPLELPFCWRPEFAKCDIVSPEGRSKGRTLPCSFTVPCQFIVLIYDSLASSQFSTGDRSLTTFHSKNNTIKLATFQTQLMLLVSFSRLLQFVLTIFVRLGVVQGFQVRHNTTEVARSYFKGDYEKFDLSEWLYQFHISTSGA